MVRFKNRYLLIAIDTEHGSDADILSIHARDIITSLRASVSQNFGDLGYSQLMSSMAVKFWSPPLAMCIIRCSRDHFRIAWAAASFLQEVSGHRRLGRVRFRVIHIGGTIRSCQKSAASHARQLILEKRQKGHDIRSLEGVVAAAKREMDAMVI